ncbi:unnamed protein product [Plutella xylostella]|uniref:(diamondback moth) hypothetical protein n=2 Tax=Plutella xylostella TaxID=51655 RepID=A0A8S4D0K6_PLUXY|nr:unnamed protein product [Plutella xylostella]
METLPEAGLLDFLLSSPYVLDLRETYAMHRKVGDYSYYNELVWPLPTHFTPRHLYKLKVDDTFVEPLPVMPWEQAEEEDEREDRDSDSDES